MSIPGGTGGTIGAYATVDYLAGGPASSGAPSSVPSPTRRSWAWLGLIPFLAFVFIFLLLPTYGVIKKALTSESGGFSLKGMTDALSSQRQAFVNSFWLSLISGLLGAILGALLAYAAATARKPKWLRTLVTAYSGVGANMGGVILAFMFFTLVGRSGLATKMLKWAGWDLYAHGFELSKVPGLVTVYMYFQVPLMFLVTLPAIDGLKVAWREAAANLGGTSWTFWRRVGLPVLLPSLLGGFLLLFANAYSAFATARVINQSVNVVPVRISYYLQGDIAKGGPLPFALATWMVVFMAVAMTGFVLLRKRAERWMR